MFAITTKAELDGIGTSVQGIAIVDHIDDVVVPYFVLGISRPEKVLILISVLLLEDCLPVLLGAG